MVGLRIGFAQYLFRYLPGISIADVRIDEAIHEIFIGYHPCDNQHDDKEKYNPE